MMRFPIGSVVALACFAFQPAEPALDVVSEAKVYVPVTVKLTGAYATTKVKWKIVPEPAWSEKLPTEVGFRFTGPPAKYSIRVDYVDFKKELWGEAVASVAIVGEGPKPPDPAPVDPTDPVVPRPDGFPGEVYDAAKTVNDAAGCVALAKACNDFANDIGKAPLNDVKAIPSAFAAKVRATGISIPAWRPFLLWLTGIEGQTVGQLELRGNTLVTAQEALKEIAVGLKAAGGVQ